MKKLAPVLLVILFAACGGGTLDMSPGPPEGSLLTMNFPRTGHTATRLDNNSVLIVGGVDASDSNVTTPEIYVPSDNAFVSLGNTSINVGSHTATRLGNGMILIIGYSDVGIFNPANETFSSITAPGLPRIGHTATLLNDGTVLVVGGYSSLLPSAAATVIYDPGSGSLTSTSNDIKDLVSPFVLSGHTADLLPNGKVLILGGLVAAIYDINTKDFIASTPSVYLANHATSQLSDGSVLITGSRFFVGGNFSPRVYVYGFSNPYTLISGLGGERESHTSTALTDGNVLVAGGNNATSYLATAERYNNGSNRFMRTGNMAVARRFHAATLLQNGKVLITGGEIGTRVLGSAEIYNPATGTFSSNYD